MMTPKEEVEVVLNAIIPFAEEQLKKNKTFYPFGMVMLNDGSVAQTICEFEVDHPQSMDVINRIKEIHSNDAKNNIIKISGICWDSKIELANGKKTDAMCVRLEHIDNYSIELYKPYSFSLFGKLQTSDILAQKGNREIFE